MRHGLFALILTVAACGHEAKKGSSSGQPAARESSGAMTIVNDEALPACAADNEGMLVYVTATKSFRTCADGAWQVIDLRGEKGDKGDRGDKGIDGASLDAERAIAIYKENRRSIFRVTLHCTRVSSSSTCTSAYSSAPVFLGSAFLCAPGVACTNAHVAVCDPDCLALSKLELQAVDATKDTVNPTGNGPVAPFFSTTSAGAVSVHPSKDLAKIALTGVPDGIAPVSLATASYDTLVTTLSPVLSMSFPLGFQDLYTDVGVLNQPDLKECDANTTISTKYACPSSDYDFSTSNDTDHGSSGSPLFDLATGKVVGVTSAGTEGENANYTWAIDASRFGDIP